MRRPFTEHKGDPEAAAAMLHKVMPIGDGAMPDSVIIWRQPDGKPRRVRAEYPNGWRLQFSISVKGVVSRVRANSPQYRVGGLSL